VAARGARAAAGDAEVVGYLYEDWPEPTAQLLAAFRKALSKTGYVEAGTLRSNFAGH
jgi:hypothetical protein